MGEEREDRNLRLLVRLCYVSKMLGVINEQYLTV
jgi:hypothetical protein